MLINLEKMRLPVIVKPFVLNNQSTYSFAMAFVNNLKNVILITCISVTVSRSALLCRHHFGDEMPRCKGAWSVSVELILIHCNYIRLILAGFFAYIVGE